MSIAFINDGKTEFKCALTVVYDSNNMEERKELWKNLLKIGNSINEPWCICGDFNTLVNTKDTVGG